MWAPMGMGIPDLALGGRDSDDAEDRGYDREYDWDYD